MDQIGEFNDKNLFIQTLQKKIYENMKVKFQIPTLARMYRNSFYNPAQSDNDIRLKVQSKYEKAYQPAHKSVQSQPRLKVQSNQILNRISPKRDSGQKEIMTLENRPFQVSPTRKNALPPNYSAKRVTKQISLTQRLNIKGTQTPLLLVNINQSKRDDSLESKKEFRLIRPQTKLNLLPKIQPRKQVQPLPVPIQVILSKHYDEESNQTLNGWSDDSNF
ncbi:hypothetical protein pb186bvf_011510 [Paramecium bursaria]